MECKCHRLISRVDPDPKPSTSASLYKMDCLVILQYTAIKAVKDEILINILFSKSTLFKKSNVRDEARTEISCVRISRCPTLYR